MKVFSQLEEAQIEQLSSDPVSPVRSRIWYNSSSHLIKAVFDATVRALVTEDGTATLTNKTIDGDDNTIQDLALGAIKTVLADANKVLVRDGSGAVISALLVNANIDASAAIARSKLATGTASHVLINDGSGVMSSEATLAKSRGGTGQDNSSLNFPASGTIAEIGSNTTWTGEHEFQSKFYGDLEADSSSGSDQTVATPAKFIKRSTGALTSVVGFTAPGAGKEQFFVWINATGGDVTVKNDTTATAADRILTGTGLDISIKNGASVWFLYDTTSSRWRVVGGSGGGGDPTLDSQTPSGGGTVTVQANSALQVVVVSGNGGAVALSSTPFGTGSVINGTMVELVGNSDTNTVEITPNDAANGVVGNFSSIKLHKYESAKFRYVSSLSRWIYVQ